MRAARQKADCVVGERTKAARDGGPPTFTQCETQYDKDLQQAQERAAAAGAVCPAVTDSAALVEYLPREGDEAVVFIHTFSAQTFDQGQQVVADGFSNAIDAFGQVRKTYFMANPDALQVVVVSFFQKGESVDDWLASPERQAVVQQLQPLWAQPLQILRQTVYRIHDSGVGSTVPGS